MSKMKCREMFQNMTEPNQSNLQLLEKWIVFNFLRVFNYPIFVLKNEILVCLYAFAKTFQWIYYFPFVKYIFRKERGKS